MNLPARPASWIGRPDLRLAYPTGHREAPDDPFGEVRLDLAADGRVALERWRGARHQRWSGRTDPGLLGVIVEALAAAPGPSLRARCRPGPRP